MKIKEVLAKVLKGEALTDEEKQFVGKYDEQAIIDTAAASARKKAEQERDGFKAKVDELTKALDDAKKSGAGSEDTIAKLQKDVANLLKANKESEAKIAAQARADAIRKAVGDAKMSAAKGISAALFDSAVDAAFKGVDMSNAEVVKATIDKFKADNPALITVDGHGGVGTQGDPNAGGYQGPNPFSKKSFNLTEGIKLMGSNPELAKSLQAEAAKESADGK